MGAGRKAGQGAEFAVIPKANKVTEPTPGNSD